MPQIPPYLEPYEWKRTTEQRLNLLESRLIESTTGEVVFFSGVEDELVDDTDTFTVSAGEVLFVAGRQYLITVFGQCIAYAANDPGDISRFQVTFGYLDGAEGIGVIDPFTSVDRLSVPTSHDSIDRSRLFIPPLTYTAPVIHMIDVLTYSVRAWSTAVITDVGPS